VNWNAFIRQSHRWLSIVFTVAVIINIIALGQEQPSYWVGFLALVPLALLLFTGWYMLLQPYATRWRSRHRTS